MSLVRVRDLPDDGPLYEIVALAPQALLTADRPCASKQILKRS